MSDPDFDKVSPGSAPEPPRIAPVDGYGVGFPSLAAGAPVPHLRDYFRVLYKRRWLVLSVFAAVVTGTAVYTYTAVPVYQANAKLLIEVVEPKYLQFEGLGEGDAAWSAEYLATQYDLLKSRTLARKTLDTLKLWDDMPAKSAPTTPSLRARASRPVAWFLELFEEDKPAKPGPEIAGVPETVKQSRAIDALLNMLVVAPIKDSRLVNLTARSVDPKLATAVANAHTRGYIEQNTEFKFQSSQEATAWLNERLTEQRKQVDAAETALQKYRESHSAIPAEDSENITVQKLSQLNEAYTAAKMARLGKEVVYNQLAVIGTANAALEAFPAILSNQTIQVQRTELAALKRMEEELLQTLDINHPRVKTVRGSIDSTQAKLQVEIQNVVKAVRTDFEASQAQERNLAAALETQKDEVLKMNQESIQFGMLKREVDSTRQIFQSLLQRARETGISTELRTTNVRIVDPAEEPQAPASPNRPLNLTLGLVVGLALGVGLGFFFEYIDDRIKSPEEIKAYLGVPVLGLLPVVHGMEASHTYPLMNGAAWPKLNEAFRTLRTNVIFSSAEQGCRSIVVTSTGPNEGKTLVSANFAISLAEAGLRVLLVDADMRRPKQHDVFQIDQEPGLSNLIVGGVKASEAIRKSAVPGLWLLPAGRISPNPAELLSSARFMEFFKSFSEHFDWVIIDTPPVMAVAEAAVVAHAVTGVLFVVRAEAVSRYAAQAALEQLDNTHANIVGAVLNRVDLERHPYYYSQYYRREYSDYYANTPKSGV